jgi:hypothetical protein
MRNIGGCWCVWLSCGDCRDADADDAPDRARAQSARRVDCHQRFARAGFFSWSLLWPFALGSIPLAYIGGGVTLPGHWYDVGRGLCVAAFVCGLTRLALPHAACVAAILAARSSDYWLVSLALAAASS